MFFLVHTLYGPGCHSGCTTDDAPGPVPKLPFLQSASQDIDQVLEEMHDEARKKNNEEKSMSENVISIGIDHCHFFSFTTLILI